MEIHLPFNFLTLLLFMTFIFLSIYTWKKTKAINKLRKLPPGPPKLPLIGNLHHLMGALPHQSLARLAEKYGPLMHLQLGEVSLIAVSSPEMAKAVLKDHDPACADRPKSLGASIIFYEDFIFAPYNKYWRHMRKICIVEVLSARMVRSFNSIRLDEALQLVKSIQSSSGELINLSKKLMAFPSSMISRALFGKVVRDREIMVESIGEGLHLAAGFDLSDLFPSFKLLHLMSWNRYKLLRMRRKLDDILDGIIREHRDNLAAMVEGNGDLGGEDIIDVLLRLKETGELEFPITDIHIKSIICDLFAGAVDTSSTVIDWALVELIRNPSVMSKAQTEIRQVLKEKISIDESDLQQLPYLKMVIKETFRLHPPGPLVPRACRQECEIDGYTIPLKANVMVNIWTMGRDPAYWHEPEIFNPDRFKNSSIDYLGNDFEFLPFGSGKRACPGMNFGLANVKLILAQLLYHFDWELPKGMSINEMDMTEAPGLTVSRKESLMVIPTCYSPRPLP